MTEHVVDSQQGGAQPEGQGDDQTLGALPNGYLLGRYELLKVLGSGGFGITYQARDSRLEREVAIKEYLPVTLAVRHGGTQVMPRTTHAANDFLWGRERFLAEARTLARVHDVPAVVRVHDFLEANGTAYLVMEFKRGQTLEARLKRDGRLPQTAIEKLLYPLLDGLERLHATGFVHRDIKPSNLIIDEDGNPTLLDFGAARAEMASRTQAATAIWTPGFAAIEQFMSDKQGPFTDIYALAATLYYCIAGAPPPSALDRLLQDRMAPSARLGGGRYSPALLTGIDAGLALKAPDRPQSIIAWRMIFATGSLPTKRGDSDNGDTAQMQTGDSLVQNDLPMWKPVPDAVPEPPPPAAPPAAPAITQAAPPAPVPPAAAAPTPSSGPRAPLIWGGIVLAMLFGAGGGFAAYRYLSPSPGPGGTPGLPPIATAPPAPATTEEELKRADDAARRANEAARIAQQQQVAAAAAAEALRLQDEARKLEQQRVAAEAARKAEQDRLAAEAARKAEQDRLAAEAARKAEQDRLAAEAARKAEQDRLAAEAARKAEQERIAAEAARKAEQERIVAEAARRAEQDRLAAEAARRAEQERAAAEATRRAEQERLAAEAARKSEQDRLAAEAARKAEQDRLAADAARRAEQEQAEKRAQAAWDGVNKQDAAAVRRFAENNPDHPRAAEARHFADAVGRNDPQALRGFAAAFPSSVLAAPARQRADRLDAEARDWPQAQNGTVQVLQQFLQRYPDLRRAGEARQRLAQLERQAWQELQAGEVTDEKLQKFVAEFPNGQYAREARQALQARQSERSGEPAAGRQNRPGVDVDRAYDPTTNLPRQALNLGLVPEANMQRRQGARPQANNGMPLFTVQIDQQLHLAGDRSQLTASVINHSQRVFDPIVDCTFSVNGVRVAYIRFNPRNVQPGEVVSATVVGPPAPIYPTEARCNPIGPFSLPN